MKKVLKLNSLKIPDLTNVADDVGYMENMRLNLFRISL